MRNLFARAKNAFKAWLKDLGSNLPVKLSVIAGVILLIIIAFIYFGNNTATTDASNNYSVVKKGPEKSDLSNQVLQQQIATETQAEVLTELFNKLGSGICVLVQSGNVISRRYVQYQIRESGLENDQLINTTECRPSIEPESTDVYINVLQNGFCIHIQTQEGVRMRYIKIDFTTLPSTVTVRETCDEM